MGGREGWNNRDGLEGPPEFAVSRAWELASSVLDVRDAVRLLSPESGEQRRLGAPAAYVAREIGLPVSPNKVYYLRAPFPSEGTIDRVVFDVQ